MSCGESGGTGESGGVGGDGCAERDDGGDGAPVESSVKDCAISISPAILCRAEVVFLNVISWISHSELHVTCTSIMVILNTWA